MTLAEHNARQKAQAEARRAEAKRLYAELQSWKAVGAKMGISGARAHALGTGIAAKVNAGRTR